jgi:hypothetical protein
MIGNASPIVDNIISSTSSLSTQIHQMIHLPQQKLLEDEEFE